MNKDYVIKKLEISLNHLRQSEEELKYCLGDHLILGDHAITVIINEKIEECSIELQQSIAFTSFVVWTNYCDKYDIFKTILEESKFAMEVFDIEDGSDRGGLLLYQFGNKSFNFKVIEKYESKDGKHAENYCNNQYIKSLGFYPDFEYEIFATSLNQETDDYIIHDML
jgi:hypothetical protein